MKLNQLSDCPGARRSRKRVGRGIGSGTGKTCGAGQKGQNSRSGVSLKGFEGGQMPLSRRLPKHGFNNIFRKKFVTLNLGRLQTAIDTGKVDSSKPVDAAVLTAAGVFSKARDGVRLLANGALKAKVDITVAGASKAAAAAVEKAGGRITLAPPTRTTPPTKAPSAGDGPKPG